MKIIHFLSRYRLLFIWVLAACVVALLHGRIQMENPIGEGWVNKDEQVFTALNTKGFSVTAFVDEKKLSAIKLGSQVYVQSLRNNNLKTLGKVIFLENKIEILPKRFQFPGSLSQNWGMKIVIHSHDSNNPFMPGERIVVFPSRGEKTDNPQMLSTTNTAKTL